MPLHPGQTLRGARWNYLITETLRPQTSTSNIFKAQILPHAHLHPPGPWAAIKTASDKKTLDMLEWEYKCYQNPAIHSSPYLRTLYESLDIHDASTPGFSFCLAFEWTDITLKDLSAKKHHQNRVLHKSVSKGVLSALDVLNSQHLVHTDIKSDNIFISSADEPIPTVKLGDLGLVRAEGFDDHPVQPLALRALEVWSGKGCFHSSDVWAFAVTLFDWIQPYVFGANDMPEAHWPQPWAMAKLMRLFPGSVAMHPSDENYQWYYRIAQAIDKAPREGGKEPDCSQVKAFETEIEKLSELPALAVFLSYLFVVDPAQRPTAAQALRSVQLKTLA